jgi:hypothetical protein
VVVFLFLGSSLIAWKTKKEETKKELGSFSYERDSYLIGEITSKSNLYIIYDNTSHHVLFYAIRISDSTK